SRPSSHSPYLSLHDASPTDIYSLSLHDALPILRLYVDKNRISPYAMSVYVALKEKGLDFQEIVIDLEQRQQKSAAYQAICPSAKDRKSTRLNSSHVKISYAVFCLKKKTNKLSP